MRCSITKKKILASGEKRKWEIVVEKLFGRGPPCFKILWFNDSVSNTSVYYRKEMIAKFWHTVCKA